MQNVPRHGNAKDDSNTHKAFHRTPVVRANSIGLPLSVMLCSLRRPWFPQFRIQLGQCVSLDEIEALLQVKVRRWRGLTDISRPGVEEELDDDVGIQQQTLNLTGFLDEDGLSDGHSTLLLESRSLESSG
jgi:hypothetical protein